MIKGSKAKREERDGGRSDGKRMRTGGGTLIKDSKEKERKRRGGDNEKKTENK